MKAGADYIVVGRPIIKAANPRETTKNIIKEMEDGYREIA
jgi:orotidine-5'-phosphate decarboxylase